MSKISRTDPGSILSKAVEYHGFVYLQGVTGKDTSKDIKGQTSDILAQIDQLLEEHGTDKTRLLQALIWVKAGAPARACVQAELANPSILVEIMVTACK
jgi:enamine deaminase RidA (YjgF/YER057c/UK114 family)